MAAAVETGTEETAEGTASAAAASETAKENTSTDKGEAASTSKEAESIGEALGEAGKESEGAGASTETTEGKSEEESAEATGAPEQYDDFGLDDAVYITEERTEAVHELMREQNLTQEQAQAFMSQLGDVQKDLAAHHKDLIADQEKRGLATLKKDPRVVGPDGDKFEESLSLVQRTLREFAGDDESGKLAKAAMLDSGVLHLEPELFVFMIGIGRALLSDTVDSQGDPGGGSVSDKPAQERMGYEYMNEDT